MKNLCCLLSLLLVLVSLPSCKNVSRNQREFFFMDTEISVTLYGDSSMAEAAFSDCREILSRLESKWAKQRSDSLIAKINGAGQEEIPLDADTYALLQKAEKVSKATDGAFDATLSAISDLWQSCGEENRLPGEELSELLSHVGYEKLRLTEKGILKTDPETKLDLGGIGKGGAISVLLEAVKDRGLSGGLISFGSNVATFGKKPGGESFRVGLRNPFDTSDSVGIFEMQEGQILSVSGDYERFVEIGGKKYHHILNPEDGYPSESGLSSVAVLAEDGAFADALSTALFVLGEEAGQALYQKQIFEFEAIFISSDGVLTYTEGMSKFFKEK